MKAVHVSILALAVGTMPTTAWAQANSDDEAAIASDNVIIVTARKRAESDLEVPIAIQAIGGEQFDRKGIQNLYDVAATVPSLNIATAQGNSGGTITLRGVGTPPQGAGTEQAVSLNYDGVTVADGLAVRLGQFDVSQVEILQGPQSLYFGKNSSGGIIAITTADPTDEPYAMLRAGYGFEAREVLTEAVVSGPLTETLGARLAFYRSDMEGYFKNPLATQTGTPSPTQLAIWGPLPKAASKRAPEQTMTGVRGTLKYDSDQFTARVKGTYVKLDGGDSFAQSQLFNCPTGEPHLATEAQVAGIGDCVINHFASPIGQNVDSERGGGPLFRDGQPYADSEQILISNSMDFRPTDGITISSVTSYYDVSLIAAEVVTSSPYPVIGLYGRLWSGRMDAGTSLNHGFGFAAEWHGRRLLPGRKTQRRGSGQRLWRHEPVHAHLRPGYADLRRIRSADARPAGQEVADCCRREVHG